MTLSLCNEVLRELDFAEQCALAKSLGYDGLEIAPFTLSDEPHYLSKARRTELRNIAHDQGIAITGLHWLLLKPDGLSITNADRAVREKTIDVMHGLIELASDLSASVLVHGSPKQRAVAAGDSVDSAVERAADCFAAVADAAGTAGVTYCIEPLAKTETDVINTVEQAARIVQEVDNPALCTMIDCCAAGQAEAETIPNLIDRWLPSNLIAHIHLNDPNRKAPGQGDMAFAPILAALRRHDYRGTMAIEPFIYEPDGPAAAARAIGYIQGASEGLVS